MIYLLIWLLIASTSVYLLYKAFKLAGDINKEN